MWYWFQTFVIADPFVGTTAAASTDASGKKETITEAEMAINCLQIEIFDG